MKDLGDPTAVPSPEDGEGPSGEAHSLEDDAQAGLRAAQRRVDDWISQFEEGYWPPLANLARLMEEVGELARLVNHRFGTKPKKPGETEQELAEELADVLFRRSVHGERAEHRPHGGIRPGAREVSEPGRRSLGAERQLAAGQSIDTPVDLVRRVVEVRAHPNVSRTVIHDDPQLGQSGDCRWGVRAFDHHDGRAVVRMGSGP